MKSVRSCLKRKYKDFVIKLVFKVLFLTNRSQKELLIIDL